MDSLSQCTYNVDSYYRMMLAFGPFRVDVERRAVYKDGVPLHLTLKCIELLIAFVRNPGKPMSKQELLEAAWPDPQASDATLAQHVFLLRRALRHDGCDWIHTIPNVGYRFTGVVSVAKAEAGERTKALQTYLDGARTMRDIGTERALRSAIDICTHAIGLDNGDAIAYALRASCWRLLAESMHAEPLTCLQSAKADAEAALARDTRNVDACVEAALSSALLDRDVEAAQRYLAHAASVDADRPELRRARVRLALIGGELDEALRIAREAGGALLGAALYMARDFSNARAILDRWSEIDGSARVTRGACALFEGDYAAALKDFHDVYYAESSDFGGVPSVRHHALGLYIYTLAKMGCVQAARERVRELEKLALRRYVSPMARAAAYVGLGEPARAIALIAEALRRCDPWSAYIAIDPMLEELRSHPQFFDALTNAA